MTKRVVGYGVMVAGWFVLSKLYDPPFFSWQTAILIAAVALLTMGSSIVEAARAGFWPWERR